jgi:hypothetical protein
MQLSTAQFPRAGFDLRKLLERFAKDTRCVPPGAHLIRDNRELSPALQRQTIDCGDEAAWLAWNYEGCIWFMIGRLSPWYLHSRDRLILHALFFDASGELVSSGMWRREQRGRWKLCLA